MFSFSLESTMTTINLATWFDDGNVPDRPDVKIKNHGLGQYAAEPHYSTLPFWQLRALKG